MTAEPRLEYVSLSDLNPWPKNPKRHALPDLVRSMERFGFVAPILIDERTNQVAAGHGRLDALQELRDAGKPAPDRIRVLSSGEWAVPVVRGVSFTNDHEMTAYALADNRLVEAGGWDDEKLILLLGELRDGSAADGIGWTETQIAALLGEVDRSAPPVAAPAEQWFVIVEARDESAQKRLLEKLTKEGWVCRALIS